MCGNNQFSECIKDEITQKDYKWKEGEGNANKFTIKPISQFRGEIFLVIYLIKILFSEPY